MCTSDFYNNYRLVQGQHVKPAWPWPLTLTLGLHEQMCQMAHLIMMENNCANSYWNPSKIVGSYGPDKKFTFKCDLDLRTLNKCPDKFWQMDSRTKEGTYAHTLNYDCDNYCMSRHSLLNNKFEKLWKRRRFTTEKEKGAGNLRAKKYYPLCSKTLYLICQFYTLQIQQQIKIWWQKYGQMVIPLSDWVENIVGKGEIACYDQFLLFLQCFQQPSVIHASKWVSME